MAELLVWPLSLGTTFLGDIHGGQHIQGKCPNYVRWLQWKKKYSLLLPYNRNKKLYNSFSSRPTCFMLFISSFMFHEGASAWRNPSPTPECQLKGCFENAGVGCQSLLFKKMNPGSTEMSGERANMKCLLHTVPALIAIDFQEWCSEDWPNICRLSEKE